ncbi:hypothetical protein BGZ63DRAFT_377065 [Mariannaea sp. PMI_226]|nr:hypothetical protein BGZ63DRAFT_377065 [Mariannaea sp. PMI_226]
MASSSRIPHLLEPYLALPSESSLTLLTSVLGTTANWLVFRHLYSYLRGAAGAGIEQGDGRDTGIVLVSFLRDATFWREGAAKLGLDLDAISRAGRLVIVDGLTGLVAPPGPTGVSAARKERVLRSSKIVDVKKEIEGAIADLTTHRKILIVDQLDALLAITEEATTSLSIQNLLLSLRSLVHSTVATMSADSPLIAPQVTTLEREHASLVLSTTHVADVVMALRMLDTGTARDVSGVVRLTGPGVDGGETVELLYHVAADGGVRVFERGT